MNYKEKYKNWLNSEIIDDITKQELFKIENDEKEIEDRFYKELEFGTGGLRGIIGAGTNRVNKYTITKATQGLANYIKKCGGENKGVVIAYDSRNMSVDFSIWTALCLNANGIKTYRFESLRPTPELSFAVRQLKCIAGIVITASHNPAEYNGYKVYFDDGAQITFPIDNEIIAEVNAISSYSEIKMIDINEAKEKGLYNEIGIDIDDLYINEIKKLILNSEIINEVGKKLKIVYTPLHGAGNLLVRRILDELGFKNVYVVKEQEMPDGDFPTVEYPNPEDSNAFKLALELAKNVDADIILATDPDADRLGIYAKNSKTGEYKSFTGNMSAILVAEYRLSQMKKKNILPKNGAIVTTIVSSNMAKAITKKYNLKLIETLTGFKYIGEQIKFFERDNSYSYVFGFEESYGCLIGTYARDKDAVSAVMALCEAAAYYYSKNLTLCDQMEKIYKEHGYYKENLLSITLKGMDGSKKIKEIMENLRNKPLKSLCGYSVIKIRDYKFGILNCNGKISNMDMPKSNVIYYELENDAWCCIRPSGTEPKIKFYYGVNEESEKDSQNKIDEMTNQLENIFCQ